MDSAATAMLHEGMTMYRKKRRRDEGRVMSVVWTSAEPITGLEPGEPRVIKFVGDDGAERDFIVSISAARGVVSVITVITDDGAIDAPVEVES
jgi:hypothetical protein